MNYYNENDPFTGAWLEELIKVKHIANGIVDKRSIVDVVPNELKDFSQCHFFAGIGGWSYALRLAKWPDDEPVWTGSCPCQPFSSTGKQEGFIDPRHLWPEWFRLIKECRPLTIFGEQVANALQWFDLVSGDMEGEDYAIGAAIMGAHSVGAPHQRQRLYWVADTQRGTAERYGSQLANSSRELQTSAPQRQWIRTNVGHGSNASPLANNDSSRCGTWRPSQTGDGTNSSREQPSGLCSSRALGDSQSSIGRLPVPISRSQQDYVEFSGAGQTNSWSKSTWIACRDNKSRPTEPGTFPLAYGVPARMGRLRGYGNAIVPQVAQAFIESYLEAL